MDDHIKRNNDKSEEVERCLALIQSRNPRDRSFAAKRLGELKSRPDILMKLLQDPNGFVRSAAAEALGRSVELPAPEVISHLLTAIDDPNHYVCAAAVNSLGLLGAAQAIDQSEACLDDAEPIVVQAAILAMARIDPQRIENRLLAFLQSDEYLVHLAAVRVCGWLQLDFCSGLILQALQDLMQTNGKHDLKLPKLYIEALTRLNAREAIPTLVGIAEHEVGLRSAAVEALVDMNADEAAAILSPLLNDPSYSLRRNLIEMMIKADYTAALPLIRPLLKDKAITVRETALAAISKWGDKVSIDDVREIAFSDPNPFVRPQAVIALTRLLEQDALADLVDLSEDLNLYVRRAVAQCLAEIDFLTPEGKKALLSLAEDPETADFVKDALKAHDLDTVQPLPEKVVETRVPVPKALSEEAHKLLVSLESWQNALPSLQKDFDLGELAEVDRALSTLILYLRETLNGDWGA